MRSFTSAPPRTAFARGELLGLKWLDVDRLARRMRLADTITWAPAGVVRIRSVAISIARAVIAASPAATDASKKATIPGTTALLAACSSCR
jgi:hypothetical protein